MKAWLKRASEHLNFTPTERAVVLTLVGALLLGLGIRLFRGQPDVPAFDYSAADAAFAEKNAAAPSAPAEPPGAGADRAARGGGATPPAHGRITAGRNGGPDAHPAAGRVDLNRATKQDLMSLPGVGEVLAERILLYREERGGFGRVDDLLGVKGIGKKKLEHIAPFCFVER